MMEYEGGARLEPDIICDMNSRDGEGASRSQKKRSEQSTTSGEGPESSVGATCRKRQRSRSRDRLMKTPGLWGGHEHRSSSRNGSPRPALSSIFPCGPVLRNTSNNNATVTHPPAQSRKSCDESASSVVTDGELVGGKLFFSDRSREEQGEEEEEDEEVALREEGHRMAFLSYRGISEEFLSLLDELTYEDSSDEYKRKRGRNSHDDDAVVEDDGLCYFPAEYPMPQPRTIDGACDEFFPENAIQGCDDPEVARHGLTSDLCV